ncbi:MAG: helix-turn-helix domain-containing protein [Rhizobiales bacterium]|nr:helix-turn-helix domain-containing protein [Hyphomicrobiales bacterium]NRB15776.1 helix-turn-helix domain-containing protein [Hyphomicrobiales bacterium]
MSNQNEKLNANFFVKSFAKGLVLIKCFGGQDQNMTLTQAAKKVGITRAAARRYLLTLEYLGYAKQENKHFSLTSKILELGGDFVRNVNIWDVSKNHLQILATSIDEACSAAILDGYEIEYVARIGTPHRIMSVTPSVGSRFPAHITSTGRAILAYSADSVVKNYLQYANFQKYTEFTIENKQQLVPILREISEMGYVILNQELEIGLRSIAIPLFDQKNHILGALTVGTHISRVSEHKLIEIILPKLQKCGQDITAKLNSK